MPLPTGRFAQPAGKKPQNDFPPLVIASPTTISRTRSSETGDAKVKNSPLFIGLILALASPSYAADWPQWLGPNRNGSSPENGLLTSWPKEGPKMLWKEKGGDGYSTVAVAGGKAVTLVQQDAEYAIAFDAVKGGELWKTKIGPGFKNSYGNGPAARRPSRGTGFTFSRSPATSRVSMPRMGQSSGKRTSSSSSAPRTFNGDSPLPRRRGQSRPGHSRSGRCRSGCLRQENGRSRLENRRVTRLPTPRLSP